MAARPLPRTSFRESRSRVRYATEIPPAREFEIRERNSRARNEERGEEEKGRRVDGENRSSQRLLSNGQTADDRSPAGLYGAPTTAVSRTPGTFEREYKKKKNFSNFSARRGSRLSVRTPRTTFRKCRGFSSNAGDSAAPGAASSSRSAFPLPPFPKSSARESFKFNLKILSPAPAFSRRPSLSLFLRGFFSPRRKLEFSSTVRRCGKMRGVRK